MAAVHIKIRHEGKEINAYFPTRTATDPTGGEQIKIASMLTAMADMYPELFDAFQAFVTHAARTMLEGVGAEVSSITAESAPEHERAGHA